MPPDGSASGVIDGKIINELKSIGGKGALFNRVLTLFVENAPLSLADIERFAAQQDNHGLADAVHALKSMCSSLGARRAGEVCEQVEVLARSGQTFNASEMVRLVVHETKAALREADKLRAA